MAKWQGLVEVGGVIQFHAVIDNPAIDTWALRPLEGAEPAWNPGGDENSRFLVVQMESGLSASARPATPEERAAGIWFVGDYQNFG
jgi:hypothetical protein